MAYFVSKFDAPRLYNYMDALAHEQEVKPIRGKPDCKPIGKRRNTWVTIRKNGHESIVCRLYHTDVIVYHKDGTIEINIDGWASQSTMVFIREVLGVDAVIRNRMVWVQSAIPNLATVGWYALHSNGINNFKRNGQGDLEYQNHFKVIKHKVNREGANNVRKMFKPFKDYLVRMMRVRDAGFSVQEFGDVFGWVNIDLPNYPNLINPRFSYNLENDFFKLVLSENVEDNYKAMLMLARTVGYHYNGNWITKSRAMVGRLNEAVLYACREEYFEEVLAPLGEIVRDPYGKYFDRQS